LRKSNVCNEKIIGENISEKSAWNLTCLRQQQQKKEAYRSVQKELADNVYYGGLSLIGEIGTSLTGK
jgi:hypothetical protein